MHVNSATLAARPMAHAPAPHAQLATQTLGKGLNIRKMIPFILLGAAAGLVIPVIPGGPLGGAVMGAVLAYLS